ncbi:hypothetical protein BV20DRAFT_1054151, partial [Pilatotrama ljubarskyi]
QQQAEQPAPPAPAGDGEYPVDEPAEEDGDGYDQQYEEGGTEAPEQGPDPMAVDRQEPSGFENQAY